MNDTELVSRILARDRQALFAFYRQYEPKLSAHIRRKVGNPADAEEILQDTLFAFLEALRDFEGKSTVSTFLFSICGRKIADYYRKKRIRQVIFSEMPQLEAIVSPLLTPEEEFDSSVLQEKISRTLESILPRYKKLLLSKYAENISMADIAKRLAVTVKSAESALFRARKAFIKAFVSM